LLFTDIEGSTRLLQEIGDQYADVLAEHRRVLREAFARHGGVEVDTQGDAFFVAFAGASAAVAGAQAAQDALRGGPIRVRMGLHTGEPMLGDEGYVGIDVHRGARLASAGHGGQILLSQSTRDLLDSTFELVDLGLHRLKDLSEPQRLYQLGTEGFPPLKTLHQTNLPVPATPFLGRERELGEVRDLLRSSRVLTLTGPGGSGKTRLALHAAAEAAEDFPDGVWWVSLSTVHDPALVPDSIAHVLGSKNGLANHIADKRLLLLLDNLEHLLDAVPELAALLETCSGVRLLTTSREPLRLAAEQEYNVPPFASEEAIDFFSSRARAARADFTPTKAVPGICRRLDNLPLALELAAARVKTLSPEQILARLEQALPLLTGGRRDAPERQRTLEATIAWSYEMLSGPEQDLFEELAVFVGGCTLEAAEEVCAADLDGLASLVDKSLIRQSGERFWMLETVREFALERLRERDALDDAQRRHADYFLAGAEANRDNILGTLTQDQLRWFECEHDNLRAAVDVLHEQRTEPELEVRLVLACGKFWIHHGFWSEAGRRHDAALERLDQLPPPLRARMLWGAAEGVCIQGEYERARGLAEASIELLDRLPAETDHAVGAYNTLGICEAHLGNISRAAELFETAAALSRASGSDEGLTLVLNCMANLALDQRDFPRARAYLEETVEMTRRLHLMPFLANALEDLGFVELAESAVDEAAARFAESLSICRAEHATQVLVWAVEGLAAVALAREAPAVATRLLAATGPLKTEMHIPEGYYKIGDETRERTLIAARELLGDADFAAAWAEGENLSLEELADAAALVS
jgi:predicted ATPase